MTTEKMTTEISNATIGALYDSCGQSGDTHLAAVCLVAMGLEIDDVELSADELAAVQAMSQQDARDRCARVVADAAAQCDE